MEANLQVCLHLFGNRPVTYSITEDCSHNAAAREEEAANAQANVPAAGTVVASQTHIGVHGLNLPHHRDVRECNVAVPLPAPDVGDPTTFTSRCQGHAYTGNANQQSRSSSEHITLITNQAMAEALAPGQHPIDAAGRAVPNRMPYGRTLNNGNAQIGYVAVLEAQARTGRA
ncbi:unnamed protein product, partial [Amoebophrya sp. A25]|eukprot:GSA25T00022149001.1